MPDLNEKFQTNFGLSDHSAGHIVAVTATALGASVIEKHITLDRDEDSIDGKFSMLPHEFSEMVKAVRLAKKSLGCDGQSKKISRDSEFYKRSILAIKNIREGEVFTERNIRIARPGDGLCPSKWSEIIGERAARDLFTGHPLCLEDIK